MLTVTTSNTNNNTMNINTNTNSNSGSRASNSGGGTSNGNSNGNSNGTSNSNNNGDGNIVVGAKVVDPIANSKRLSTIVLGAVMLMSPVIVVGNFIWLLSDSFTIIGLPIQKHLGQDVWTICDSKRYIMITNGICNNNNINSISSSSSSNECMRWGTIDEDKWQVVNDNNIYFQRYDYDIVKEVRTLWPYIEAISIILTIISLSNFIFILPLADFNNRFIWLDAQKILLLLSSLACLANMIVISYILYLSQYAKVLESITWTEQVCRYRVQQSFGLFLLLVSLVFSILSVLVCLYRYHHHHHCHHYCHHHHHHYLATTDCSYLTTLRSLISTVLHHYHPMHLKISKKEILTGLHHHHHYYYYYYHHHHYYQI